MGRPGETHGAFLLRLASPQKPGAERREVTRRGSERRALRLMDASTKRLNTTRAGLVRPQGRPLTAFAIRARGAWRVDIRWPEACQNKKKPRCSLRGGGRAAGQRARPGLQTRRATKLRRSWIVPARLHAGTYVFSWNSSVDAAVVGDDSITIQVGIPEPSTWAMMLLGFAGLGMRGIEELARPPR
jgi:hypothetical protein